MKNALKKQLARCRKGLCLLLVLACLLPLSGPAVVMEAGAVTQAEVNALREKSKGLSQQKKDLQSQLKTIQANKSDALDKKDNLEQQVDVIQEEISNLQQQISAYEGLIGQKANELAETEAKEKEQYDLFCQRVQVMEEEGETSYWSILFNAENFSDMLDRLADIDAVMDYDNQVMEEIEKNIPAEKGAKSSSGEDGGGFDDHDELLMDAIECVVEAGQASTSMIQRRLKVGYARAGRLVDEMEEMGIVGPFEGSKPRQVLISKERWYEMKLQKSE